MIVYDDIFEWEGWGGRLKLANGRCRLRIYDLFPRIKPLDPALIAILKEWIEIRAGDA